MGTKEGTGHIVCSCVTDTQGWSNLWKTANDFYENVSMSHGVQSFMKKLSSQLSSVIVADVQTTDLSLLCILSYWYASHDIVPLTLLYS